MKLKIYNVINIYTTIKTLIENENFKDSVLKFKMLGLLKSLETPMTNYQTIQYDTIKELGAPVFNDNGEETGNYTIPSKNKETVVIFNKGIAAEQLIHLYPIIEED